LVSVLVSVLSNLLIFLFGSVHSKRHKEHILLTAYIVGEHFHSM